MAESVTPEIHFKHRTFLKMLKDSLVLEFYEPTSAHLIAVQVTRPATMPFVFFEFDTAYLEIKTPFMPSSSLLYENTRLRYFPFDVMAPALLLIFWDYDNKRIFPTMRKYSKEKEKYYRERLNQKFEVVYDCDSK